MDWRDMVIDSCGRVLEVLEPVLAGLTQADLDKQPQGDCNSLLSPPAERIKMRGKHESHPYPTICLATCRNC